MGRQWDYDHQWLDELIAKEVAKQVGIPVGTIVAHGVTAELETAASQGKLMAAPVQRALIEQSLIQIVESHLRREPHGFRVGWNGKTVSVKLPARLGVRAQRKDPKGVIEQVVQYPLWLDSPWEVVASLRRSAVARRDGFEQQVLAFDKVLALRARYPDETPRKAAELEGLDLATFEKPAP